MKPPRSAPDRARKPRIKSQVAAMPVRAAEDGSGALRVMLVTSRETRRWIIPKGWPMKGLKNRDAAAREAFEEAGVVGRVSQRPIGRYRYFKRTADSFQACDVAVYRLDVDEVRPNWEEAHQRERAWFNPSAAAQLVEEPELKHLLLSLAGA